MQGRTLSACYRRHGLQAVRRRTLQPGGRRAIHFGMRGLQQRQIHGAYWLGHLCHLSERSDPGERGAAVLYRVRGWPLHVINRWQRVRGLHSGPLASTHGAEWVHGMWARQVQQVEWRCDRRWLQVLQRRSMVHVVDVQPHLCGRLEVA